MQRTILGLCVKPIDGVDSLHDEDTSLQVNEVQQTMGGQHVYAGEAASIGSWVDKDAPNIHSDGTISTVEMSFEKRTHSEWLAMPDAKPGFVAIDTSDAEFVFSNIGVHNGGLVLRASFALDGFVDDLISSGATIWQILWSDGEESGSWYPANDSPEKITDHALKGQIQQVGFQMMDDGRFVRGTVARSGYCELYDPDMSPESMAVWLRDHLLQHSGVEGLGSASEIAEQNVDSDDVEEALEEQQASDEEEEEEAPRDEQLASLDQLDSVTVSNGGKSR